MAITMCMVNLTVMHSYAAAAAMQCYHLRDARAVKRQNQLFGGILMAVGAGLFFVKRNPS